MELLDDKEDNESRDMCLYEYEDILVLIFKQLGYIDNKCLLLKIPIVCKRWNFVCKNRVDINNVEIKIRMIEKDIENMELFIRMYMSILDRFIYFNKNELIINDDLTNNEFHDLMLKSPKLTHLKLDIYTRKNFSNNSLQSIINCKQLRGLTINWLQIPTRIIKYIIDNCNNITELDINTLDDTLIKLICDKYPNLKKLICNGYYNNFITDIGLINIYKCLKIEHLEISSYEITDKGIEVICKSCPKINSLHLEECLKLTNTTSELIANYYPNMINLTLHNCYEISNIDNILINCSKLLKLIIGCDMSSLCVNFIDILNNCTYLESLDLYSSNVILQPFYMLNSPYTNLKEIILTDVNITDDIFKGIVKRSPLLKTFEFNSCNELTSIELHKIHKDFPNLEMLCDV